MTGGPPSLASITPAFFALSIARLASLDPTVLVEVLSIAFFLASSLLATYSLIASLSASSSFFSSFFIFSSFLTSIYSFFYISSTFFCSGVFLGPGGGLTLNGDSVGSTTFSG